MPPAGAAADGVEGVGRMPGRQRVGCRDEPAAASGERRRVYPLAGGAAGRRPRCSIRCRASLHQASLADAAPALLGTAAFAVLVWLVAVALAPARGRRRGADRLRLGGRLALLSRAGPAPERGARRRLFDGAAAAGRAGGDDRADLRARAASRRWHALANTVMTCIAVALLVLPLWRIGGVRVAARRRPAGLRRRPGRWPRCPSWRRPAPPAARCRTSTTSSSTATARRRRSRGTTASASRSATSSSRGASTSPATASRTT